MYLLLKIVVFLSLWCVMGYCLLSICPKVNAAILAYSDVCLEQHTLDSQFQTTVSFYVKEHFFLEKKYLCFALYLPWKPLYQWVNSYKESFGVQFCYTSTWIFPGYQWVNSCDESLGLQLCYTSLNCFFSVHLLSFLTGRTECCSLWHGFS